MFELSELLRNVLHARKEYDKSERYFCDDLGTKQENLQKAEEALIDYLFPGRE